MTLLLNTLLPFILGLALAGLLLYIRAGVSLVRLIIGAVWVMILFGIVGYLITKVDALPLRFLVLMSVAMAIGVLYLYLVPKALTGWTRSGVLDLFLPGLVLMVFGISGFLVSHYTLAHPDKESNVNIISLLAAFPAFLLPSFCVYSYDQWASIPTLRYPTWTYPLYRELPRLHPEEPIKIKMNYTLQPTGMDGPFEGYEVEFPTNVPLGDLFHYFIAFHNRQPKNRNAAIQYLHGETPVEWILYRYALSGNRKVHLAMDKTLPENGIQNGDAIFACSLVPTVV